MTLTERLIAFFAAKPTAVSFTDQARLIGDARTPFNQKTVLVAMFATALMDINGNPIPGTGGGWSGDTDVTAGAGVTLDFGAAQVILPPFTNLTIPVFTKKTAADYAAGTTEPRENYGGIIYVTAAATITLPAALPGMNLSIITIGGVAVSVDPNAADLIIRDGTTQADGEKITNDSTTGDIAVLSYYDATGWYATSNGWTNGG